ncbi:IS1380 family transposase [bacterium]
MRQYTNQLMLFKELFGKKVQVDFKGGDVSSDAGLLLLRETEAKLGLFEKVANAIHDNRHPGYIKHGIMELLKQRVYQIASGYEDANDSNELRKDPILKIACDKPASSDSYLASQPTISRFENAPKRTTLYRIARSLLNLFIESYEQPPEGIVIDFDDTADSTYGNQQLTFFNAYHACHCYMPMHIYEGKTGKLITTILRPGKRPSGKEIVSILKRIVRIIREAWPDVGILIRGDSYYSCPAVYKYCKEHNIRFIFGFKPYSTLVKRSKTLMAKAKELFELNNEPVKIYSEFSYKARSWETSNRIIVKAEYNSQGPNTRFIVTDLEHKNRKFLYETVYCNRGAMELMIKAHKNHLASDRTSCSSFQANQFRLFLHSMAYILMHHFRSQFLQGTEFAKAQFNTIRTKIIKIGARVHHLVTKIKIQLPNSYPYKEDFFRIWRSVGAPSYV